MNAKRDRRPFPAAASLAAAAFAALAAVAAVAATDANAQQPSWYLGAAVGQARTDSSLASSIDAVGIRTVSLDTDLEDTAGKLWLGYRLSPTFALEASFGDYGEQRLDHVFEVPGGPAATGHIATLRKVKGWGMDFVAGTEISAGLTLFGKIGAFRGETTTDTTIFTDGGFYAPGTPDIHQSEKADETVLKFGLGVDFALSRNLSARLEWERLSDLGKGQGPSSTGNTGEADTDAIWLGVNWRF